MKKLEFTSDELRSIKEILEKIWLSEKHYTQIRSVLKKIEMHLTALDRSNSK